MHFSKGFAGNRVLGYTLNAQVCWQMQCISLHLCEKTSNSCLLDRQRCVFSRASFVKHTWVIGEEMRSSLDDTHKGVGTIVVQTTQGPLFDQQILDCVGD